MSGQPLLLCLQLDNVKGELLERFKVLPVLSSRVSELENNNDELREKNRQMEQKLGAMQVRSAAVLPRSRTGYHGPRPGGGRTSCGRDLGRPRSIFGPEAVRLGQCEPNSRNPVSTLKDPGELSGSARAL